jgi:pimeloyl-ACP methyl ester carboxylesterase
MEAAKVLATPPPTTMSGSEQLTAAPLSALPSPAEKGFFYPELTRPVPTQTIEAIGKIAGTDVDIGCTIEGPADKSLEIDRIPLLVAGGYFGPETAYDEYRSQLAQRGKWAVTWNSARSLGLWHDLNLLNVMHPQILASRTALGVTRAVTEATGFKKFDGSGHSNGCQPIAELAIHRPDLMRTITFKGGVGLDQHNILQMAPRLGNFFIKDVARPRIAKLALDSEFAKEEIEYAAANVPLTFAEMYSAGSCNLHRHIKKIRQLGTPIAAIQYPQDDFFPLEAVERDSRHLFDIFHVFRDPSIRHTGPQEDPSGSAEAQLEVLGQLLHEQTRAA